MFLYNSTFFCIMSLFHRKFRQCALFSLELTNALLIALLSLALFDHVLKDNDLATFQCRTVHDNFDDLVTYLNTPRSNGSKNESEIPIFELVIIPYYFNESDNPTLADVMGIQVRQGF